MTREVLEVTGAEQGLPHPGTVIRYGHFGRPVLVFPTQSGHAHDYEDRGMIEVLAPLIDAGRIKIYAVDSFDSFSWSDRGLPTEERARRHRAYEAWILDQIVPFINADSPGHQGIVATGCSLGAYHAVNLALKRPDIIRAAVGLSGSYDPTIWRGWGEVGEATYFASPTAYVAGMHGEHLDWVRSQAQIVLVAGQGPFEVQPTQSLPGTQQLGSLLADKGIPHLVDIWGHDAAHDWPWWHRQISHHLPRFV